MYAHRRRVLEMNRSLPQVLVAGSVSSLAAVILSLPRREPYLTVVASTTLVLNYTGPVSLVCNLPCFRPAGLSQRLIVELEVYFQGRFAARLVSGGAASRVGSVVSSLTRESL
jgi:hypothetical protein